jgi:CheY-like chemotaxis protein
MKLDVGAPGVDSMRLAIVVLEDNEDRIRVMQECLADKFPFFEQRFFRSAPQAMQWLDEHLPQAACIVLDHDLEPTAAEPWIDPGTGRDVADQLASRQPHCPVVIHTSNAPAAAGMEMVLADAGWAVSRVLPYADTSWIAAAWLPAIRDAVVQCAVLPAVKT